jgi:hypothetical protein
MKEKKKLPIKQTKLNVGKEGTSNNTNKIRCRKRRGGTSYNTNKIRIRKRRNFL